MSNSLQKSNKNHPQNGQDKFHFIPNHEAEKAGNDWLDPQKLISLLLQYKWVVIGFVIAGLVGARFYAETVTPSYESNGKLLISSTDGFSQDEGSQIISQRTGYVSNTTLENELEILQSRKFSLDLAGKFIEQDSGGIKELPILWTENEDGGINRADQQTVAARIRNALEFKKPKEESDVLDVSFNSPSPQEAAKIVNLAMEIYVANSAQQNRQATATTVEFLEEEKENIQKDLQAAEATLRRYMDSTGIVQIDEQATGMVNKRADIEAELMRVKLDLQAVDETIDKYEKQFNRIKPGLSAQFAQAIGPRIRRSQEELARYESERTLIISKNPGVLDREEVPVRLKFVNDQIERLKGEITDLSDQLFTEDQEFMGMDSEDRAELVTNIQNQLVELRVEKNLLESRQSTLANLKDEVDSGFNSLPEGMIELAKLQRDVRINEELFLNVSRRHANISVLKESQFGFGRIIDPGETPNVPVSPNKLIYMILGVMLGGLCSVCFIAVREFRDNSVKNVDQLRTAYLPTLTLSVIPSIEDFSQNNIKTFKVGEGNIPDEVFLLKDRSSIASESIRRLKNNIIYQNGDHPPQTIAVTSPEKGDGKSTVVANLGIAFAEEGYKTLVIDADFRRPKLHKYFGIANTAGLSDYLKGMVPFDQLVTIIRSSDLSNLKVLTAGTVTQKPDIIGNSRSFKEFLNRLGGICDVIILDTPPFGIISDSTALLKIAEATLVVAKYRKTNRAMLLRTIEELGQIQANVTGIVLNDFDHRQEAGQYYGAGYYQTLYNNYDSYSR